MSTRKFKVISSYYHGGDPNKYGGLTPKQFFQYWEANTLEEVDVDEVVIFNHSPESNLESNCNQIEIDNLGHVGDLLNGSRSNSFCGWSSVILAGAALCYASGVDMIFKEQDCLAFGPWVDGLYNSCGNSKFVFGNNKVMGASQSLFLIKWEFLPIFIREYLSIGPDKHDLPESKFIKIEGRYLSDTKRLTFGYDRDRPFNIKDKVFYIQQINLEEMNTLKQNGLINELQ